MKGTIGNYRPLKKLYATLLAATASELWQTAGLTISMNDGEAAQLLRQAELQTVGGLVADALVRNNIPMERRRVVEALLMANDAVEKNKQINDVLKSFANTMHTAAIPFLVVKGQSLNALYPSPGRRTCGDIDFCISPSDYHRCRTVIKEAFSCCLPEHLLEKEIAFTYRDQLFELHTRLLDWRWPAHGRHWKQLFRQSLAQQTRRDVEGISIPVLAPKEEIIYTFVHAFHHLLSGGIGLRQLCDIAVLLHHHRGHYDAEVLMDDLRHLGVAKAFRLIGVFLTDRLGLPEADLPFVAADEDRRMEQPFVEQVILGGNFGKRLHDNIDIEHHPWRYKLATMRLMAANLWRYRCLAPMETALALPQQTWINLRLALHNSAKKR